MCVCVCVWGEVLSDCEEEEKVVLKNAPLIFDRGAGKDLLFCRIRLPLKNFIAFIYHLLLNVCVCAHHCTNGPKCPA